MDSLCSEDMQEVSVCYCICRFPLPSFCQYHAEEHKTKSSAFHYLLPPSASQVIISKDVYFQAKSWLQHLSGNQDVLREKVEEFAKYEEKIEAAYQEILQLALDTKEKFKQAFSVAKEAFKTAVQGAIYETCLNALDSQWTGPTNLLSQLLWVSDPQSIWAHELYTFQAGCVKKYLDLAFQVSLSFSIPGLDHLKISAPLNDESDLQELKRRLQDAESLLFAFREESSAKEERCQVFENEIEILKKQIKELTEQLERLRRGKEERILRKGQPQLNLRPHQQIACICSSYELFDIATNKSQYCGINGAFINSSSSWTFIGSNQIFGCGAAKIGNLAWILEEDGNCHELPKMKLERSGHGIIYDSDTQAVYVYGGASGNKMCEKFIFPTLQWEQIADMHESRFYFNPCKCDSNVYLCGGNKISVELYSIQSNTFALVPDFILPESQSCTAVVESECIIVVSKNYICRWSLQEKKFISSFQHPELSPHSKFTPVVSDGFIYITKGTGYDRISIETGVKM